MHPTANSVAFIRKTWMLVLLNARRVMPGFRRLFLGYEVMLLCRLPSTELEGNSYELPITIGRYR